MAFKQQFGEVHCLATHADVIHQQNMLFLFLPITSGEPHLAANIPSYPEITAAMAQYPSSLEIVDANASRGVLSLDWFFNS